MDSRSAKCDPAVVSESVGRTIRARAAGALAATRNVETVAGAAVAAMETAEAAFADPQEDGAVQRSVAGWIAASTARIAATKPLAPHRPCASPWKYRMPPSAG